MIFQIITQTFIACQITDIIKITARVHESCILKSKSQLISVCEKRRWYSISAIKLQCLIVAVVENLWKSRVFFEYKNSITIFSYDLTVSGALLSLQSNVGKFIVAKYNVIVQFSGTVMNCSQSHKFLPYKRPCNAVKFRAHSAKEK